MNVRQANIDDLEQVLIYAYKIAYQHQSYNPVRFSEFPEHNKLLREYFKTELCNDNAITILLTLNDEVVGYSLVKMDEDNLEELALERAWLNDIFIDEKARSLGGGKLLLEASKDAALKLGSTILMLHVATQNSFAKIFFEKSGFVPTLTEMMLILK